MDGAAERDRDMKVCGHTMGVPDLDMAGALALFKSVGFDGIEVRCAPDGQIDPESVAEEDLRAIADAAARHRLQIVCLTSYYRDFVTDLREDHLRGLYRVIRIASRLRCPLVRAYGGIDPPPPGRSRAEVWDRTVEALRKAAELAVDCGVSIAIETHSGSLTQRSEDVLSMLRDVGKENVGILFDYAWIWDIGETDVEQVVAALGPSILHCHFKDWKYTSEPGKEKGRKAVLMGQGDIPWPRVFAGLRQAGYRGYCSDEYERYWHPEELPTAEIGMRSNLSYVRALIGPERALQ